jgi:putative molybdopterin biosynthesis protein
MGPHVETPTAPGGIGTLYTTMEVAKMLRVSQRTVQDWIRNGELTAVRYGRMIRVRQGDLEAFGEVLTSATLSGDPPEGRSSGPITA